MKNNNIKADDKVQYDGYEPQKFTNFELLQKKVEVLIEELMLVTKILEQNDLKYKEETFAETDECNLDDEVFNRLDSGLGDEE